MIDETESPRGDLPAGDGNHPGQGPARSITPENGENAPSHPSGQSKGKQGRDAAKGTGALLLSRITGILRQAAEEAPGDPVAPEGKPGRQGTETVDEMGFIESLGRQPRQGTGQLHILVTGVQPEPEGSGAANEQPVERAPEAQGAGEDHPEDGMRKGMPYAVTGQLNAPFTGSLRHNTDDLSELRAEMEAEGRQDAPDSGAAAAPGNGAVQPPSAEEGEDAGLLELLLARQQGRLDGEGEQEKPQGIGDLMKQIWGEDPADAGKSEDEDARLEDRFAMLGGEAAAHAAPPEPQAPRIPEPPAGPHFDDSLMFPGEQTPLPFAEAAAPERGELPIAAAVPEETTAIPAFTEAENARPSEPEAPPAPRGKGGRRSETIYEDLRQTLAEEESSRRRRSTGGLLRRITGSLRRTTESLRKGSTGPVGQPEPPQPLLEEAQILDAAEPVAEPLPEPDFTGFDGHDFEAETPPEPSLALEGAADLPEDALVAGLEPAGQASPETAEEDWMSAIRQEGVEEPAPPVEEQAPAAVEAAAEERPRSITGKLAKIVTGILGSQSGRKKNTKELDIPDEVVTGRLQRSMVTGPLNGEKTRELDPEDLQALEMEQQMAADRIAAESAPPEEEIPEPQNQGITGQLRSFITGILRSSEPPGSTTGPLQTSDLPDSMVAGRVEQSQPSRQRSTSRRTSDRRETFDANSLRQDVIDTTPAQPTAQDVSEDELLRGLGAVEESAKTASINFSSPGSPEMDAELPRDRFDRLFGNDVIEEAYAPSGETGSLEDMDEKAAPQAEGIGEIDPEDIWGSIPEKSAAEARQPEDTIWYVPEEEGEADNYGKTGSLFEDEISEDALVAAFLGGQTGQLQAPPTAGSMAAPDLRAIALENYGDPVEDAGPMKGAAEGGEAAPELEFDQAPAVKLGLMDRIARLTVLQKILLAEVVLLVVLVPFMVYAALAAPKPANPAVIFPMPHALPDDVPYPTGLTLTGGWNFDLGKSTFVEGKWAPSGSEWLEGTEVRRVVALPWNKQTDAVVRTFQPGDPITLTLSNQDEVQYKIVSIERRASTEADFLADRKLSLVILLYDEESEDRWVITSER